MEHSEFKWNQLGDVSKGRINLGEEMPVMVYRLFQYTMRDVLSRRYGKEEMIDLFRTAGEQAGHEFATNNLDLTLELNPFIAQLQSVRAQTKIGILRIEKFDTETGNAILTVSEDLDCSGLPVTGETVCNYDEGFIAGILAEYTKKDYIVTEIDCWAMGDRVCRFDARVAAK